MTLTLDHPSAFTPVVSHLAGGGSSHVASPDRPPMPSFLLPGAAPYLGGMPLNAGLLLPQPSQSTAADKSLAELYAMYLWLNKNSLAAAVAASASSQMPPLPAPFPHQAASSLLYSAAASANAYRQHPLFGMAPPASFSLLPAKLAEASSLGCSPVADDRSGLPASLSKNKLGRSYNPGRPLAMTDRQKILELYEKGVRISHIARIIGVTHSCVSKIMARYRRTGSMHPRSTQIKKHSSASSTQSSSSASSSSGVSVASMSPAPTTGESESVRTDLSPLQQQPSQPAVITTAPNGVSFLLHQSTTLPLLPQSC